MQPSNFSALCSLIVQVLGLATQHLLCKCRVSAARPIGWQELFYFAAELIVLIALETVKLLPPRFLPPDSNTHPSGLRLQVYFVAACA